MVLHKPLEQQQQQQQTRQSVKKDGKCLFFIFIGRPFLPFFDILLSIPESNDDFNELIRNPCYIFGWNSIFIRFNIRRDAMNINVSARETSKNEIWDQ